MHPNNMTGWDEIKCLRDCDRHYSRQVEVKLAGKTGYQDLTPIPFELGFPFLVWDTDEHPVDGGLYCPARDAVSETILSHGVWEPRETTVAAHWFAQGKPFVDMGAQLGWFSIVAALHGCEVHAVEADQDNLTLLEGTFDLNDVSDLLTVHADRVGPGFDELPEMEVGFVKIDLEGAEDQAVRVLWPSIRAGLVDAILMEVSPVFDDYYPGLVNKLINQGYEAYMMPPKRRPPHVIDGSPESLSRWKFSHLPPDRVAELVESWHQEDVLFVRSV